MAQPSTRRQMGPTLSRDQASAMAPVRLTLPKLLRNPVTRHSAEGATMEAIVSVPMANPTRPAAVAAAGPADEPPLGVFGSHGLRVCPPNHLSPVARAPVASLAT